MEVPTLCSGNPLARGLGEGLSSSKVDLSHPTNTQQKPQARDRFRDGNGKSLHEKGSEIKTARFASTIRQHGLHHSATPRQYHRSVVVGGQGFPVCLLGSFGCGLVVVGWAQSADVSPVLHEILKRQVCHGRKRHAQNDFRDKGLSTQSFSPATTQRRQDSDVFWESRAAHPTRWATRSRFVSRLQTHRGMLRRVCIPTSRRL